MTDLFDSVEPLRGDTLLFEFHNPNRKMRLKWALQEGLAFPFLTQKDVDGWVAASPQTRRPTVSNKDAAPIMKVRSSLDKNIIPEHLK